MQTTCRYKVQPGADFRNQLVPQGDFYMLVPILEDRGGSLSYY